MAVSVISFFWGGFVTPVAIGVANRFQILDSPGGRKIHSIVTPRGAGLGLWLGYLLLCLYAAPYGGGLIQYSATGATLVFFCGYLDDIKSQSPLLRLIVHLFAAWIALTRIDLSPSVRVLLVIWVAGVTSAYNFIDGVNGLCLSMFMAASVGMAFIASETITLSPGLFSQEMFAVPLALCGMALGTFCWNFPKAQTFLGDGGATLLGFLFALHSAAFMGPELDSVHYHELILLLTLFGGVPVIDTLVAFVRRVMHGKSPFLPDRGHLHHRLMDLGLSLSWIVMFMSALQCGCMFLALQALIRLNL